MSQDSHAKAFVKEFIGGTVGGWAQVVVGHPFDTLKVRLQTNPQYVNAMDCARKTVVQEGPLALYKGVTSPLMGVGFCNAVVFACNGYFRRLVAKEGQSILSIPQIFAAGSLTGLVVAFVNCPFELLKVKLQTQYSGSGSPKYKGVLDCGVQLARQGGLTALYRGIGITLIRDVPSFGAYFATYEIVKRRLQGGNPSAPITAWQTLMAGGIAGFGAWIPAYMQDVVKSRYQADPSYTSWVKVAKDLYADKGIKAFWRGIGPTLLRAFPANAVTFLAYNWVMKNLERF